MSTSNLALRITLALILASTFGCSGSGAPSNGSASTSASGGSSGSSSAASAGTTGASSSSAASSTGSTGSPSTSGSTGSTATAGTASTGSIAAGDAAVISGRTRAIQGWPLTAQQGDVTMVVWTEMSGGQSFGHTVWERMRGTTPLDHGDLATPGDSDGARLEPFHAGFLFMPDNGPNAFFDGTAWTTPPGFTGTTVISGDRAVAVTGRNGGAVSATVFDGSAVSAATQLNTFGGFDAVAGDGHGGFGVVSHDSLTSFSHPPVHFIAFDGSHWGADGVVYTPTGSSAANNLAVSSDGAHWRVFWTDAGATTVATLDQGAWSLAPVLPAARALQVSRAPEPLRVAGCGTGSDWVASLGSSGWTTVQIPIDIDNAIDGFLPFNGGSLLLYGSNTLHAAIIDAAGAVTTTALDDPETFGGVGSVAVNGTSIGLGFSVRMIDPVSSKEFDPARVVTFAGGTWSSPVPLTTTDDVPGYALAPLSAGGFVAFYAVLDELKVQQQTSGAWSSLPSLTQLPSSGAVADRALARAADGTQLAVWLQWDLRTLNAYASQRAGGAWSAPVQIASNAIAISVAAGPGGFVIGWTDAADGRWVAPWNLGVLGTPVDLGQFAYPTDWLVNVVSDGARYAAVWVDGAYVQSDVRHDLMAATSTDGITWSAPVTVESGIAGLPAVAGGPGGIAALSIDAGQLHSTVHVLTGAGWTASAPLSGRSNCALSVATTTLLAACSTATSTDAALFDGTSFTSVPGGVQARFALGNDGTDYRIEYATQPASFRVLHAGSWSAPTNEPQIDSLLSGLLGRAGDWTVIYAGDPSNLYELFRSDTSGATTFPFGQPFDASAVAIQDAPLYLDTAGTFDAAWIARDPDAYEVPALHVKSGF